MPRTARERIAPNIYRDNLGIAAIATAHGQRKEKRFPAGTAIKTVLDWQATTRATFKQRKRDRRHAAPKGTLNAAVTDFIAPLTGRPKADARLLLGHWTAVMGTRALDAITTRDVRAQLDTWKAAGVAANTINHRRRALLALFDAAGLDNPVKATKRQPQPAQPIRAISMTLAEAIVDALPDYGRFDKGAKRTDPNPSKTRARLRVMLWTGLPQSTLARIRPEHIDLDAKRVTVQPRRKGKGAAGLTLPLLPKAVEAFRELVRVGACGPFSTRSMAYSFRRAVNRARTTHPEIPPTLRAYDLRHTFLSYMVEMTGDLVAVAHLAQHTGLQSIMRYVGRGASARATAAIESVASGVGTTAKKAKKRRAAS